MRRTIVRFSSCFLVFSSFLFLLHVHSYMDICMRWRGGLCIIVRHASNGRLAQVGRFYSVRKGVASLLASA
ncbi:hypothetical protein DER44DRAFT_86494 [Fusarium oxysporum]|nr:hypothetical protein DER44DRAFT_86494 [Fusarium oxysporum]